MYYNSHYPYPEDCSILVSQKTVRAPNSIMTLNYWGENTGCPDLAVEYSEAVMSGFFYHT